MRTLLQHLHAAVAERRVEVAGAGVERLVVVLVGVDRAEGKVHAVALLWSWFPGVREPR